MRVLVAGSGGQGILTFGRLLAYTAINRNWQVSCLPTYGAEMRGGYVYCLIIISNTREVSSPVSGRVDVGIFMQEKMLRLLSHYVKPGGTLLLNCSLVHTEPETKFRTWEIDATNLAESLGNLQVANMVMSGALGYLINKEYFPCQVSDLSSVLEETLGNKENLPLCEKALTLGWKTIEEKWKT